VRIAAFVLCVIGSFAGWGVAAEDPAPKFVVIVVDGLRPDYVTADVMPNLHRLGEEGVFFENHHAVVPTVTRVNSASFATGSYPETHGLMGNSVYFPSVDPDRALNTSDYRNLIKIQQTEGRLLTATTLGEVLDAAGKQYLVISSGSSGSSYLLNPELNGAGIINVDFILPAALRERVLAAAGPAPEEDIPATARIAWTVDAYIKLALDEIHPDVTFIWMTDPDHTAHDTGIGSPEMVASLQGVDAQIGRIIWALKERGLDRQTNVIVTSDHGFSTHRGGFNLLQFLKQKGLSDGVHIADGAIYVDGHDEQRIEAIAQALREQTTVGPIFSAVSATDSMMGRIPNTLPYPSIHWQHVRSGDLLVFPAWDSEPNGTGFQGHTALGGVAGHGTTSPWDIHNTLIANGPSFKRNTRSVVPSANVDIAPTILQVLAIPLPESMTGRALVEAETSGPSLSDVKVESRMFHAIVQQLPGAVKLVELARSEVSGHSYIDSVGLSEMSLSKP